MEFDWNGGELAAGLKCYKQQKYFEAHEHWETLWRQAEGVEKTLFRTDRQTVALFADLNNLTNRKYAMPWQFRDPGCNVFGGLDFRF